MPTKAQSNPSRRKTAIVRKATVARKPTARRSNVQTTAAKAVPMPVEAPTSETPATALHQEPAPDVRPKPGSKLGLVLSLLEAPEGASLAQLVEATGWLPHTTRAALTGLRKRGFTIVSEKTAGSDHASVYRLHTEAA